MSKERGIEEVATKRPETAPRRGLLRMAMGLSMVALSTTVACLPRQSGLSAETVLATRGSVEISAGDYDAIAEASTRFNVSFDRMGTLAICESEANAGATNGSHDGLYSQARSYWSGRVAAFEKATGLDIDNNIRNARSNALVSAWMINARRNSSYSKSHNGLPSDWSQCLIGWNGGQGLKSQTWYDAKARLDQLSPLHEVALAEADIRYQQAAQTEQVAMGLEPCDDFVLAA